MSKQLIFLSLIGLMLFVLAIAGQDRSPLAKRLTGTPVTRVMDAMKEQEESSPNPHHASASRAPASVARTLDIEPVEPGAE